MLPENYSVNSDDESRTPDNRRFNRGLSAARVGVIGVGSSAGTSAINVAEDHHGSTIQSRSSAKGTPPDLEDQQVIQNNRAAFIREYGIVSRYSEPGLVETISSTEPIARQFSSCEYFRTANSFVLAIHPTHYRDDAQWLWRKEFIHVRPFNRVDRHSFVKIFPDITQLRCMMQNIAAVAEQGLQNALLFAGLSVYLGKILHVTTGSGKTRLRDRCTRYNIIDADDLIVLEITRQYPFFRLKRVPPVENIFKFCKNMLPEEVAPVMTAVRLQMRSLAADGCLVLSGNISLMDTADYVLIQRNPSLWKELFEVDREVEAAVRLGKPVTYISDYLDIVLSCSVDQI